MADNGFNASAYDGLKRAESELGIQIKSLESKTDADYAANITAFIGEGCDIIVTVGFLLGEATQAAAQANPDQKFAIVDYGYNPPIPNVLGLVFDTKSSSMLQGYLAAGMTTSGIVATFGVLQIGLVTEEMDGFVAGVNYYNQQKGTSVKVLGWDPATTTGTFPGDPTKLDSGKSTAEALLGQGADILYVAGGPNAAAGPVGQGALQAVNDVGNALFIGVDLDGYVSAPGYESVMLSSALKRVDTAVFEAVKQALAGSFPASLYVGTLANEGVGIAPFHDLDSRVPQTLKDEVSALKVAIVDGSVRPDDYE